MENVKTVKEAKALAVKGGNIDTLISQAIGNKTAVETMERLLAMRTQLKQEQAKEDYNIALSEFQSECPAIGKNKKVMEKDGKGIRYKYAPLDEIILQVKPFLYKHGFSYTFNAVYEKETINDKGLKSGGAQIITCTARHIGGWSETAEFRSPIDWAAYMSDVQKQGSAMTFAKRYAFCSVFGIMTGDEDNDGATNGGTHTETTRPSKVKIDDAEITTNPVPLPTKPLPVPAKVSIPTTTKPLPLPVKPAAESPKEQSGNTTANITGEVITIRKSVVDKKDITGYTIIDIVDGKTKTICEWKVQNMDIAPGRYINCESVTETVDKKGTHLIAKRITLLKPEK